MPLGLLRGWIHAAAAANPLTRLLEASRSLLAGQPVEVGIAFAAAAGLVALFSLWALGGLRRAEAANERGAAPGQTDSRSVDAPRWRAWKRRSCERRERCRRCAARRATPGMRALVLDGTGFDRLRVERVPTPRPGPRQLLARVESAGICASLIKLVEQGPTHPFLYGWDLARWPLVLGDEGSVTLVEIGAELRDTYAPGASVT